MERIICATYEEAKETICEIMRDATKTPGTIQIGYGPDDQTGEFRYCVQYDDSGRLFQLAANANDPAAVLHSLAEEGVGYITPDELPEDDANYDWE